MAATFHLPPDIEEVTLPGRNALPEEIFSVVSNHTKDQLVGMLTQPPYSGAPVMGHVVHVARRNGRVSHLVFNGFATIYGDVNTGNMVVEYMTIDKLVTLGGAFTCCDDYLAQWLRQDETRPWQAYLPKERFPPFGMFTSPPPSPERDGGDEEMPLMKSVP